MSNLKEYYIWNFFVLVLDHGGRKRIISYSILFVFFIAFKSSMCFSFVFKKLIKTTSNCYKKTVLYFTFFWKFEYWE